MNHTLLKTKLKLQSIFTPWVVIKDLRRANEKLIETITDPLLTGINIGNGSIDIGMEGAGPQLIAGMFLGMLEQGQAVNYVEVTLTSPKGPIIVTATQPTGKTPHQLLNEAKARIAALELEKLARLSQDAGMEF